MNAQPLGAVDHPHIDFYCHRLVDALGAVSTFFEEEWMAELELEDLWGLSRALFM